MEHGCRLSYRQLSQATVIPNFIERGGYAYSDLYPGVPFALSRSGRL